jgi:prepilin-type processing-associated H-X9-DG protein
MKPKKYFSIVEMMTVVFIILALMTLIAPVFTKLRMNARNAVCKSQLRQIGILINSYASSYDGYLPNDDAVTRYDAWLPRLINDLPAFKNKWDDTALYQYWNGHLLPFINTPLKTFERRAKVSIDGKVRWGNSTWDSSSWDTVPADPLYKGWVVVNDAYTKGGFQDLKTFICPEIFTNTYDVRAFNATNGRVFPRIKLAEYCGFEQNNGNYMGDGIPTTYIANDYFFGKNGYYGSKVDSLRIDQINEISKKVYLMEGGICYAGGNWSSNEIYFGGGNRTNDYDLVLNAFENAFQKGGVAGHKLSFVHDDKDIFWTSFVHGSVGGFYYSQDVANDFNLQFEGKAYMLPCRNIWNSSIGYQIVSFIEPDNGKTFKSFFDSKGIANQFSKFDIYDEKEFHYVTGNANLLFGDGSVQTKDQGWIYNNRNKIAQQTQE